jgi:hypothetical protein
MKIKDEVLQLGSFSFKDGEKTRFWEDTWVGSERPIRRPEREE